MVTQQRGLIDCEGPSEYLDVWEGSLQCESNKLSCE